MKTAPVARGRAARKDESFCYWPLRPAALIALSSFGEPLSGARRYGNSFAKNTELMYAPSVYLSDPAGASAGLQPPSVQTVQSTPIATRSSMSTTSSPGRRPFGKPALSPPSTPRRFCAAPAVGAIAC